jgi:hypothetical protein
MQNEERKHLHEGHVHLQSLQVFELCVFDNEKFMRHVFT